MRVENNNLAEITQTKNKVEMKGNVTVSVEETTACKVEKNTGKVTSGQTLFFRRIPVRPDQPGSGKYGASGYAGEN